MTREQAEQIARSVLTAVNADTSWPSVNHVANAIMEAVAVERAEEREACAKVCENLDSAYWDDLDPVIECAKQIRTRGNE